MPRIKLIKLRGGTFSEWETANPVLEDREPGWVSDYRIMIVGDGVKTFSDLWGDFYPPVGGAGGSTLFFESEEDLIAALDPESPDRKNGEWALVQGEEIVTIWTWSSVTSEWSDTAIEVSFVIDIDYNPTSSNAQSGIGLATEFAKYLKTDGTISINQVTDLPEQLDSKLEESDIYNIVSGILQQDTGIALLKTGSIIKIKNTNPESGDGANWGSIGGDITTQADLQTELKKRFSARVPISKPWAASVALTATDEANEVFRTDDASADYAITLTSTATGYAYYQYIITLDGITSLELSLPSSVKERGKDISGNVITIEGEIGDEVTIYFEKRGSNWELFRTNPSAGGATTLEGLTDVDATGKADGDVLAWDETADKWVPATPTGGSGSTNLTATPSPTDVVIASDTGTDATIVAADGTNAGLLLPAEKEKLSGIATGATANDTDSNLKNRANHTGTQTASTISDFNTAALAAAPAETTTTEGALINGATAKTTPVDADFVGLMDSAASNILKKLSWANIKATLKTYFDTLYVPLTRTINGFALSSNVSLTTDDIAETADRKYVDATQKNSIHTRIVEWSTYGGGSTNVVLTYTPISTNIFVYVRGLLIPPSQYSLSGQTVAIPGLEVGDDVAVGYDYSISDDVINQFVYGLDFSTANSSLTLGTTSPTGVNVNKDEAQTWACFVAFRSSATNFIFSQEQEVTTNNYKGVFLRINSDGKLYFALNHYASSTLKSDQFQSSQTLSANTIYSIVITKTTSYGSGTAYKLYVNKVEATKISESYTLDAASDTEAVSNMVLGARISGGTDFFSENVIFDLARFSKALTQAEVDEYHDSKGNGIETSIGDVVLHQRYNTTDLPTVDHSGNGHTGTAANLTTSNFVSPLTFS